MKRFVSLLVGCLFAVVGVTAQAQTSPTLPAELNVNWTLPTETECLEPAPAECVRLPLTGPYAITGVQLFVSTSPIPDNSTLEPVASAGRVTQLVYNQTVPNGSTLYVRVKAVNAFGPSPKFSNQASKLVLIEAPPGEVTNATITLTIGT